MLLSPTLQYRYVGLIYGWGLGEKDGLVTSSNGDVQMHKTPRVDGGQKQHRSKHNEPPLPQLVTGHRIARELPLQPMTQAVRSIGVGYQPLHPLSQQRVHAKAIVYPIGVALHLAFIHHQIRPLPSKGRHVETPSTLILQRITPVHLPVDVLF